MNTIIIIIMRHALMTVFSITVLISACNQKQPKVVVLEQKKEQKDTTPIEYQAHRDSIIFQTNYGSIYFTTDRSARSYTYFNQYGIDEDIFEGVFPDIIQSLKTEHHETIKHFKHPLLNTTWSPLYWFNNDYCLFSPEDWMSYQPIFMTDSVIYCLQSDPSFEIIKNFRQLSPSQFEFTSIDYYGTAYNGTTVTTTIDIIDSKKGIAIWEYKYDNDSSIHRELKVKTKNVKLFPILICDCGGDKCVFDYKYDLFSTPNYAELKKRKLKQ